MCLVSTELASCPELGQIDTRRRIAYNVWTRSLSKTVQIIQYRATSTLQQPQIKQSTASNEGCGVTKPTGTRTTHHWTSIMQNNTYITSKWKFNICVFEIINHTGCCFYLIFFRRFVHFGDSTIIAAIFQLIRTIFTFIFKFMFKL